MRHKSNQDVFGPAFPALNWVPAPRYIMRRHLILSHLKSLPPGRVIDIGPGIAALLHDLSRLGWECTGVETSSEAYQKASKAAEDDKNISMFSSLEPLKPRQGYYDCLMSFEVLEHIKDDRHALRDWLDLLKPGGLVVLSVPAHHRRWTVSDLLVGHFRRYEAQEFKTLIEDCGCTVESIECYGWPVANISSGAKSMLDRLKSRSHKKSSNPSADAQQANTDSSGIERRKEQTIYNLYNGGLGRTVFRFFFWLQDMSLKTEMGNGFLAIATKKAPQASSQR